MKLTAYSVKLRKTVEISEPKIVTLKNGRNLLISPMVRSMSLPVNMGKWIFCGLMVAGSQKCRMGR